MIRSLIRTPALVAAAAVLGAGCAGERGSTPTPTRLTPLPATGTFATLDYRAGDLFTMDSRGRLLLSDADAAQVVAYAVDGAAERRLGRKGAGPGEQMIPSGAAAGPDGGLVVVDAGLRRLTRFDAGQQLVATHPLPGMPLQLLSWDGKQALLVWMESAEAGPVVGRLDAATGKAEALYRPFQTAPDLAAPRAGRGAASNPWVTAALAPDGRILVGRGEEYRIFALDAATGAVRQTFGRPDVEREMPSEREAAETEEKMTRMFKNTGVPPEIYAPVVQEARQQPKPFFLMHSFAADGEGRLWVATQRGAYGETQLDLFGADGTFLRTLKVRDRVRRISVALPYLAVLVERQAGPSEGAEGVDLYRVDALP